MKKLNVLLGKSLRVSLSPGKSFQEFHQAFENAMNVVTFFFVMAATGHCPLQSITTLGGDDLAPSKKRFEPDREIVELFATAYRLAGRIEASIDTKFPDNIWGRVDWWTPDTCLLVRIIFYKPGREASKLLEVYVGVDSCAARKYSIPIPDDDRILAMFCRTVHSCVR